MMEPLSPALRNPDTSIREQDTYFLDGEQAQSSGRELQTMVRRQVVTRPALPVLDLDDPDVMGAA